MEKNDENILRLKEDIQKKREAISLSKKKEYKTNCALEFGSKTYNLHVAALEDLKQLHIMLELYKDKADALGYLHTLKISNYSIPEWIEDVKSEIENKSNRKNEKALRDMEKKLNSLLSEDKKTEISVSAIEALLNEI
jgi:uncharacterized protein (DUF488 family)